MTTAHDERTVYCDECDDTGFVEAYLIRHDAPEGSEAERIMVPCPECGDDDGPDPIWPAA